MNLNNEYIFASHIFICWKISSLFRNWLRWLFRWWKTKDKSFTGGRSLCVHNAFGCVNYSFGVWMNTINAFGKWRLSKCIICRQQLKWTRQQIQDTILVINQTDHLLCISIKLNNKSHYNEPHTNFNIQSCQEKKFFFRLLEEGIHHLKRAIKTAVQMFSMNSSWNMMNI